MKRFKCVALKALKDIKGMEGLLVAYATFVFTWNEQLEMPLSSSSSIILLQN